MIATEQTLNQALIKLVKNTLFPHGVQEVTDSDSSNKTPENSRKQQVRRYYRITVKPTIITPYLFLLILGYASYMSHNSEVSTVFICENLWQSLFLPVLDLFPYLLFYIKRVEFSL